MSDYNYSTSVARIGQLETLLAEAKRREIALKDNVDAYFKVNETLKRRETELQTELSACKESPGGCGYWRESAKTREQERDQLAADVRMLKQELQREKEFHIWAS